MVLRTSILSANSAVPSLFGSATAILITVTLAIRGLDAMIKKNAQVKTKKKDALLRLTIPLVEKNLPLGAGCAEAL